MKVTETPAGPLLDAAVARALDFVARWPFQPVKRYSSDPITAAWELVERLRHGEGKGMVACSVEITIFDCLEPDDIMMSVFSPTLARVEAQSNSAPLTICRAFLLASGVTEIEGE